MRNAKPSIVSAALVLLVASHCVAADDHKYTCRLQMLQIYAGKEQWAVANKSKPGDPVVPHELHEYMRAKVKPPKCPGGGTYSVGAIGEQPKCSVHGEMPSRENVKASIEARKQATAAACANRLREFSELQLTWASATNRTIADPSFLVEVVKLTPQGKDILTCPAGDPYGQGVSRRPPFCVFHSRQYMRPEEWGAALKGIMSPKEWCIRNMEQIDSAKEQWALGSRASDDAAVNIDEASQYAAQHFSTFKCSSGGKYSIGHVNEHPSCSVHGNL